VEVAILLIGDYPVLLSTRAQLLRDWPVSTADSATAVQALEQRRYDLLILCQTVPGSTAEWLIAQATKLYPEIRVLALWYDGETRRLNTAVFAPDIYRPSKLREAVASLLQSAE
jgi:hypothetical protein